MNSREMLEKAVIKVGVSELARQIGWGKGAIDAAKKGDRPVPPFRASQIASILGLDPKTAYIEALKEKTIPEEERRLLGELLKVCKASTAGLTIAVALAVATLAPAKVDAAGIPSESAKNIHYAYNYLEWRVFCGGCRA